jgi:hypothetical protein
MTEEREIGCRNRLYCPLYRGKYKNSPIIAKNFREICDSILVKKLREGNMCPIYDAEDRRRRESDPELYSAIESGERDNYLSKRK